MNNSEEKKDGMGDLNEFISYLTKSFLIMWEAERQPAGYL